MPLDPQHEDQYRKTEEIARAVRLGLTDIYGPGVNFALVIFPANADTQVLSTIEAPTLGLALCSAGKRFEDNRAVDITHRATQPH